MIPFLSLPARAVFAAACLPPLLATTAFANRLLTPAHPVQVIAVLLAASAAALTITLAAAICAGPHRRRLGFTLTLATAASLLPLPAAVAWPVLGSTLACWLLLLAGTSVSQRIPDWFAGARSNAAMSIAHVLGILIDLVTIGAIAAVITQAVSGSSGHLATAVTVGPLLIARAVSRHRAIHDAVFGDAVLLDIVRLEPPAPNTAHPDARYRATAPMPSRDGDA